MTGRRYAFLAISMLALTAWAGEPPAPKPEPPKPHPLGPPPPEIGPQPEKIEEPVPRTRPNLPRNRPKALDLPAELSPVQLELKPSEKSQPGQKVVGEILTYDIRVNGVPAGQTRIEVTRDTPANANEADVWVVKMETRSNRAVGLFYKVRDVARTRIDVKHGFSRFYEMDMSEGDTKAREQISMKYDFGAEEASAHWLRTDGVWREKTVPLNGKVLDPLSCVFYLRSKTHSLSHVVPNRMNPFLVVPVCADHRLQNAALFAVDKRIEDIGNLKGRNCLIVEPECEFKGLFEKKNRMRVWLDCETGVVLKMTAEIPIGSAEVILSEHKNSPIDE